MPNNKQAKKRMRQDDERRIANKTVRSSMRSAVKRVLEAETPEAAQSALPMAMKRVDKAAKINVIHENAAARVKSRMARAVNQG
jgi:small subunit ribosomal protein S20